MIWNVWSSLNNELLQAMHSLIMGSLSSTNATRPSLEVALARSEYVAVEVTCAQHALPRLRDTVCCVEDQAHRAGACFDEQSVNPWHGYVLHRCSLALPRGQFVESIRQDLVA